LFVRDGFELFSFYIFCSAQRIDELPRGYIVINGVTLKITPSCVQRYIVGKIHILGHVFASHVLVGTKRGELVFVGAVPQFYRARIFINGVYGKSRFLRADGKIFSRGGRADIVVRLFGGQARYKVAYSSPHNIQRIRAGVGKVD